MVHNYYPDDNSSTWSMNSLNMYNMFPTRTTSELWDNWNLNYNSDYTTSSFSNGDLTSEFLSYNNYSTPNQPNDFNVIQGTYTPSYGNLSLVDNDNSTISSELESSPADYSTLRPSSTYSNSWSKSSGGSAHEMIDDVGTGSDYLYKASSCSCEVGINDPSWVPNSEVTTVKIRARIKQSSEGFCGVSIKWRIGSGAWSSTKTGFGSTSFDWTDYLTWSGLALTQSQVNDLRVYIAYYRVTGSFYTVSVDSLEVVLSRSAVNYVETEVAWAVQSKLVLPNPVLVDLGCAESRSIFFRRVTF
ncbi:hypothetical protein ES708_29860 [subsurface metagenome]